MSKAKKLFTIGYEQTPAKSVLNELERAGVKLLVDVRAVASSRRPGFSKTQLAAGLDVDSWLGIFAPAKTPPEIIVKLRREIRAALPDLKERFEKSGGEVWDVPDDKLNAFIVSEHATWTKLIREAGIKLD